MNPLKSFRVRVVDGVWQKGRGMTVPAADTMLGHYLSHDQNQTSEMQQYAHLMSSSCIHIAG